MLSIAHSVGQCRALTGASSSQRLLRHPQRSGFHGQRPHLRPQTLLAQGVQQTCGDQPQEQVDICTPAKGLAAALTTCAAALATAFVAVSPAAATLAPADIAQLQETLTEVWENTDSRFVDSINRPAWDRARQDASERLNHAETKEEGYIIMQAMLATLDDPFTRLLVPSQGQSFQADTTGQLVHIGMQAQKAETEAGPFVRVSFVLTGSPAHKAGMHVGDILTAINGRPAASIELEELSQLLRHDVQLLVRQSRPKAPMATRNLYLQARPIEVYPVISALLPGDKGTGPVGYVAIQSFGTNTGHDTATALHALKAQGASSFVLDLRGNSGGLVSAGVEVSGLLLHKDDVFVHVSHKHGYEGPMLVEEEGFLAGSPLALLVNNGTASTSEMLSATLHANTGAPLIGEHTFGKGRTQRILNMKDGSTLLVSTSLVTTPAFERIDKVGLEPDKFCKSGADLPEALRSEPLEDERLNSDLQADPCVRMALAALRDAPPLQNTCEQPSGRI